MFPKKLTPLVLAAALATPLSARAQVPGTPALQNAFANPGLAVAGNFGGGGGQSYYGAAVGYGMMSGKLMLSGGAGVQRTNDATRGAYGGRVAAMLWNSAGGSLGASVFGGVGGAARTRNELDVETNAAVMTMPVGATIGYRRAFGSRGVSGYASPIYRWTRTSTSAGTATSGSFGLGAGVDVGLTRAVGATVGAEFGGSSGARTTTWALAISFVPGR